MWQDLSPLRSTLYLLLKTSKKFPGGEIIWQQWILERITLFMWRLLQSKLPIDANVKKNWYFYGFKMPLLWKRWETIDHLFFQGAWATCLWKILSEVFECAKPESISSFNSNWAVLFSKKDNKNKLRFGLACYGLWEIWCTTNKKWHGEGFRFEISKIKNLAVQILSQMSNFDAEKLRWKESFFFFLKFQLITNVESMENGRAGSQFPQVMTWICSCLESRIMVRVRS